MPRSSALLTLTCLALQGGRASALDENVDRLVQSSCIACHDGETDTSLNFELLGTDLGDAATFRTWQKIFDRLAAGDMPPLDEPRPDEEILADASAMLHDRLSVTVRNRQTREGRVPARRLTRTEYEYTLQDLLGIGGPIAKHLPPENPAAPFDTVAAYQGMSSVHIQSYLAAADLALAEAIQMDAPEPGARREIDYRESPYIAMWLEREVRQGGQLVKKIDDALVTFSEQTFVTRSDAIGFHPRNPGVYRVEVVAAAYQAETPVTLTIIRESRSQGGATLLAAFDLLPGEDRTTAVEAYFMPGDAFALTVADADAPVDGSNIYAVGGAKFYKGEGIAIKRVAVEGPLAKSWPPAVTRDLRQRTTGLDRKQTHALVRAVVGDYAPRLFRRPVSEDEIEAFTSLADSAIVEGGEPAQCVRVALRGMLASPQLLYFGGQPGPLDDHALASRLSYFLWKTLPDEQLLRLAGEGRLSDPEVLTAQVDRMIDDARSERFVRDFLGQWLELENIDATTPDKGLYPEYDEVLRQAMLAETESFFAALLHEDLPAANLIDADFTFLSRRLAEHYGVPGIAGEHVRRVELPAESPRGGILTNASVLKVTANGTVTSPVKRGQFVLAAILGTPPSPPPPGIGSVEPDTRGTTTIRETLEAHQSVESCASCHRDIDPPGFALESFDAIGGYRTRYRSTGGGDRPASKLLGRPIHSYRLGPPVDCRGTTADGFAFDSVEGLKRWLMTREEQVARNLAANLVVYSTGGEVEFADRQEIDRIAQQTATSKHGVRAIVHAVVQSPLFRNK